jgi:subtilisin family serine protease
MVVAVIDTGVDPLHPVLRRLLLAGGLDLVDGDLSPWEERDNVDGDDDGDVDEAAGHGTFVASLVAVTAPGALILPYRVLDDEGRGTAYHLAVALADAIERRVDVINLSLVYRERSSAVDLLLERAAAQGIVVIASAGNDGSTDVPFPASDSNTLAVAALGEDGLVLAPFSNRSHLVGFAAPGEEVFGALDELSFGTWSGTSMAAPFVAGTAALLLSADPGLDPVLVRNAIEQSGFVLEEAGWTGRVLDALAAVSLVKETP